MTLDEAIIHAEETYKKLKDNCIKCADEHKQLAEWLSDYKKIKNKIKGAFMFSLCKKHSDEIKEENKDYSEDYQLYDQIDYKIDDNYCIICRKIEHLRYNKTTPLIRDLRNCKTKEEVDSIFKTYNILDIKEKIASLKEAVFNPKMSRRDFDEETELAIWIDVLLIGDWKLNYLYERLGF